MLLVEEDKDILETGRIIKNNQVGKKNNDRFFLHHTIGFDRRQMHVLIENRMNYSVSFFLRFESFKK